MIPLGLILMIFKKTRNIGKVVLLIGLIGYLIGLVVSIVA